MHAARFSLVTFALAASIVPASAQAMTVDEFRRELVGVPLCGTPESGPLAGKSVATLASGALLRLGWGGFFSRDKWNADGYSGQTRSFVRVDGDIIRWGYHGKHNSEITSGIRIEDIQWLVTYLASVTDEQLRAGLQASGATPSDTDSYVQSIRDRISQLQNIAGGLKASRQRPNQDRCKPCCASNSHANNSLISVLPMKLVPDIGSMYWKARPEGAARLFVQSMPSTEYMVAVTSSG